MKSVESFNANLVELERAAWDGDPEAQFKLAESYYAGRGCSRDGAAAYRWYLRAAEQQHASSEFRLAVCYLLGIGAKRSTKEAGHYLLRASVQGHPEAQYLLGALLAEDRVFKRNEQRARYWLERATAAGNSAAETKLQELPSTPEDRGVSHSGRSLRLDLEISDVERRVCVKEGEKAGRQCAKAGLKRFKQKLAWATKSPSDVTLYDANAVYDLSVDSARRRGYLDPYTDDGLDRLCDGSDPSVLAYKAAFMEGVIAGVKSGLGDDETPGID